MLLEAAAHVDVIIMKAQASIEFIFVTSIVVIIFLAVVYTFHRSQEDLSQQVWGLKAQSIANELGDVLERVYLSGSGASEEYTIPEYLPGGVNYSVTVRSHLVTVQAPDYNREFDRKVLASGVNGSLDGLNVPKGVLLVENRNDTLYIMEVGS